jgi:heptosyltransferase I
MKVLLIKMSSMGDIFHTFPAVTDLIQHRPDIELHWVVEEGFAEIVSWHPGVARIIPIALRRWMKMRNKSAWQEFKQWKAELNQTRYDLVIDAQGLLKSLLIAKSSQSNNIQGYDKKSARESWVSFFYHQSYFVDKNLHAVQRTRQLLSKIGQYPINHHFSFGIQQFFAPIEKQPKQLVFVIGTSWTTKLWDPESWKQLTQLALVAGYQVDIVWGSEEEKFLADSIIQACPGSTRPNERMSITAVAQKLVAATAVVGLDTGFSHLSGALEIPTIALYGATSPTKVGLIGEHTHNLQLENPLDCMPCHKRQCKLLPEKSTDCPPCLARIEAENVWQALKNLPIFQSS